jgi:hypothetical protein
MFQLTSHARQLAIWLLYPSGALMKNILAVPSSEEVSRVLQSLLEKKTNINMTGTASVV